MVPDYLAVLPSGLEVAEQSAQQGARGEHISKPIWLDLAEPLQRLPLLPPGQLVQVPGIPGSFCWGIPPGVEPSKLPLERPFVFWFSRNLPHQSWHCLAASRLNQQLAADHQLLVAFSQVIDSLRGSDAALLYAPGFTLSAHLRAASQRTGLPLLELREIPLAATQRWFRQQAKATEREPKLRLYFFQCPSEEQTSLVFKAACSGRQASRFPHCKPSNKAAAISAEDWLAVHLASRVHVFSVRPGGQIEKALQSRLQQRIPLTLDVRLLDAPHLTRPKVASNLHRWGAVRWRCDLPATASNDSIRRLPGTNKPLIENHDLLIPHELGSAGQYLYHWTRRTPLNRRRESDQHFLRLLRQNERKRDREPPSTNSFVLDSSPLRTLMEIVTSGRIEASGRWTITNHPVVSLTAQPLEAWPRLRTFRPHLGRWDFEPFGVGLDRELVELLGGRPVTYGDDALLRDLNFEDLPWFQQAGTRREGSAIDWTVEREWRVPCDIDLKRFGPQHAFLFVPNSEAAELIAQLSRWPVVVIKS